MLAVVEDRNTVLKVAIYDLGPNRPSLTAALEIRSAMCSCSETCDGGVSDPAGRVDGVVPEAAAVLRQRLTRCVSASSTCIGVPRSVYADRSARANWLALL